MQPNSNWFSDLPRDRVLAEVSLWSADLLAIGADMDRIDRHTDIYHLDVSDGHFSPALLIFPDLVAAIRKRTSRPLHVHLMATDDIVVDQIEQFADAGADLISVHAENNNLYAALDAIDARGILSGVVLQLDTPVSDIERYSARASLITLLGTRIGVKGQGLDEAAESRLSEARNRIDKAGRTPQTLVAADGGIREHTVERLATAGAQTVVLGSLAFSAPDLDQRMGWVRSHLVNDRVTR
ncbi:ribulose-phosphate 3-epimerase [Devosia sp. UYZn731]|uniref:ribulose-phosphate 3-epimerase n=1 Tax=Devosia sp. UYZn731 TaxID=3156345 RepID=UPI003397EAE7